MIKGESLDCCLEQIDYNEGTTGLFLGSFKANLLGKFRASDHERTPSSRFRLMVPQIMCSNNVFSFQQT